MPLTLTETRELLEKLGHMPQKALGQNFLIEGNLIRKTLQLANMTSNDVVVEVGPGLGTLTRSLLEAGASVYAVEYDRRLAQHLKDTLAFQYPDRFFLLEGDALDAPLASLKPEQGQSFKIVANLPYAIATPWLAAVLDQPVLPTRIVLMLQKEAAHRFMAPVGSKHFEAISIFLQSVYRIEGKHFVPPQCFYPKPTVDSMLLSLTLKEQAFCFHPECKTFIRFCFRHRRKQLLSVIRKAILPEGVLGEWELAWKQMNLPRTARAETIPLMLWQALNQLWVEKQN